MTQEWNAIALNIRKKEYIAYAHDSTHNTWRYLIAHVLAGTA
jgi:ABC-type dipeptide/oligopeptide/nickel transport system permease subunit